jgi:VanZ family protein
MKSQAFFRWLPALLWMVVIFYFSSLPEPFESLQGRDLREALGIGAHVVEYFILTGLLLRAVRSPSGGSGPGRRRFAAALGIAMLYALSDELHQTYVPGRVFDWRDLVLDLAGAGLAVALALRLQRTGAARRFPPRTPKNIAG